MVAHVTLGLCWKRAFPVPSMVFVHVTLRVHDSQISIDAAIKQ